MAKTRLFRRKGLGRKMNDYSEHAPLAALAPVMAEKHIFEPIHQQVDIRQKTRDYRPTDKLVFVTLGIFGRKRSSL